MSPRGSNRTALERHLRETRDHARRIETRLGQLDQGWNPIQAGIGLAETVIAQALAIGKTPIDLVRGSGGEEKLLKNAKDAAATEALEIATYTALERLATATGDTDTAQLAAAIRADEERMLQQILAELPALTDAVFGADVLGVGSYDVTRTGAADTARAAGRSAKRTARSTGRQARRSASRAGRTASEQASRGAERAGRATAEQARRTRSGEPWAGYDDQNVEEIRTRLDSADDDTARTVRDYERRHKDRAGVVDAAKRELASA
jgi:ferritin-like metal-binding protein YciE